ncbi:MAG: aldose 1-epimerase [Christensenellales bacterium]|jgi:aldose 1-epimerase
MAFRAELIKDGEHTVVKLTAGSQSISILQDMGANMYRWEAEGVNMMPEPVVREGRSWVPGSPVLFPTPNRVWNAAYQFKGRIVHQRLHGKPHVLHGLVGYAPFALEGMGAEEGTAWAVLSVSITEGEALESYPWPCRLTLTYTLYEDGPELVYRVDNLGEEEMPFGFAIHPYFSVLGEKEDVTLQVPAPKVHVSSPEHYPTGEVIPVDSTKWDLRQPVPVSVCTANNIDDVYFGMDSGKTAVIRWNKLGRTISLNATDDFTHMVVYTPDMPVFCLENQTCSTDFINRAAAGYTETAHMMTLRGGESHTGSIRMRYGRL